MGNEIYVLAFWLTRLIFHKTVLTFMEFWIFCSPYIFIHFPCSKYVQIPGNGNVHSVMIQLHIYNIYTINVEMKQGSSEI